MDVDGIRTVAVITVAWAVAFVALALRRAELEEAGLGWFLWTCLAGVGLGLLGLEYCRKRRDAIARAELEAEAAADLDDWDAPGEADGFDQRYDEPRGHSTDEQPAVTFAETGWEEPGVPPTEPPEYHDHTRSEPAWGEPGEQVAGPPVYPGSGSGPPDVPPGTGEQPIVDPLHPDWQAPTGPIPPAQPPPAAPPLPTAPPAPATPAAPQPAQPPQLDPRLRQPAPEEPPPPPPPPHRQPPPAPPPSRHRREPSLPFPVETASPAAYSPEPDLARRHPRDRELSEQSHREDPDWNPLDSTSDPGEPDAFSDRDREPPAPRPAGPPLDSEFFADVGPRPDPDPGDSDDLLGDLVGGEADPGEGSGGGRRARRDADGDTGGAGETYRGRRARRAP